MCKVIEDMRQEAVERDRIDRAKKLYNVYMSGILKSNGVHLEPHEYATVQRLLENGFNVELIAPMRTKGLRTPDILINGILWEIKSPEGGGKNTIKHNLSNAGGQSSNVIIDLQRCKLSDEQALKDVARYFKASKKIHRLKIFKKSGEMLDFKK